MNDASRAQGWAICAAAGVAALLFLIGLLNGSYWALAIPVAIVTFFALGLVAWVGYIHSFPTRRSSDHRKSVV